MWLWAEALLADVEIVARVERRRKWTAAEKAALLAETGAIEITLPNGARVCVDAFVNETALARVLRAMRSLT